MVKEYKGQDESNWLDELVYRLTYAAYREAYRVLYYRIKGTIQDLTAKHFNDLIDLIRYDHPHMFFMLFQKRQ
jgi:hypothetical protein